ncbi:tetratricopeptide repeat protein [Allonocardiopsis opalescens]|uniref:Putative thioredoxin n=1 Tax=Allonocardiopsis opalescens TaxID=1144618 RepID=A0A2T0Q935_9ACTN|nr:tetratricopeptide repeat protein [Allonocardiopsis opalescens]PRY00396.1 putative thioredoxin [Allonocardiopsis opalescens]
MQPSDFSLYGAVDLGARKAAAERAAQRQANPAAAAAAIDVGEADFQAQVLDRSMSMPVILGLWSERTPVTAQLRGLLEKLAGEAGGRWILANLDADANPRVAQALRPRSLPEVFAIVAGQVVPFISGGVPSEEQARQALDQLFTLLREQGLLPEGAGQEQEQAAEPQPESPYAAAAAAAQQGDFDGAVAAYQAILKDTPGDATAQAGLAQVQLVRRVREMDAAAVRRAAAERPDDVQAQIDVADLDVFGGKVEDAFDRLVSAVRRTRDDDRDRVREHLLELFRILPPGDQRVAKARRALTAALF